MHQNTKFESPKRKNSFEWEWDTPSHNLPRSVASLPRRPSPLPHEQDTYSVNVYLFSYSFGIDNIPTNSPKVCTRLLSLNPPNAKTPPLGRFAPSPVILPLEEDTYSVKCIYFHIHLGLTIIQQIH